MLAKQLQIVDEIPCCVLAKLSVWYAFARTALVEKNDAIMCWIEKASIIGLCSATWSTVHKDYWMTIGLATLFEVERVNIRDFEHPSTVGLDRRK